jgi:hypothetical protein
MRVAWAVCVVASVAIAGEGKWTPQQVLKQGPTWVKAQGFELPLSSLWDAKTSTGLLANAVQLPGCSGSFVSPQGLLITNHHCVVGVLQEHSSPQENLVRDGYLARSAAAEKPAKAFRIQVPKRFRDVTAEVLAAVPAGADALQRFKSVESVQKRLVADCEKQPKTRCQFAQFDGGLFFTLTEFSEITDVRLVYAPPSMVGDYGGEVDNWSWPRHTGDFSLLRAYEDGKPYAPKVWFPLSPDGVKPNSAVAVLGYPGVSYRAFLAAEMAEREQRWFPAVRDLTAEWIRIIEQEGQKSQEAAIATADDMRTLLNRRKNAEGQLAGLKRGRILEVQAQAEDKVKGFAVKQNLSEAVTAHAALSAQVNERLASWERDFLFDSIPWGPRPLAWGVTIARRSSEGIKPDLEREPGYMERDLARLRERLERDQKHYAVVIERRLMFSWLKRALALPPNQRSAAVDAVFSTAKDDKAIEAQIDSLLKASPLLDVELRKKLFEETPEQLKARKDPLIDFGLALDIERRALKEKRDRWAGEVLKLRPEWRRAVLAEAKRPVAPDANSTLRVTFCRVKGYAPRDAVAFSPQTTVEGMLAKNAGAEPFDVPKSVMAAAEQRAGSRWVDKGLNDIPVDFLADCDTSGGNSGSPTIDGKGRLVGVNFDRVWENVANDFGYNPAVARNVNADVRYLLWLLESVEKAPALLAELLKKP